MLRDGIGEASGRAPETGAATSGAVAGTDPIDRAAGAGAAGAAAAGAAAATVAGKALAGAVMVAGIATGVDSGAAAAGVGIPTLVCLRCGACRSVTPPFRRSSPCTLAYMNMNTPMPNPASIKNDPITMRADAGDPSTRRAAASSLASPGQEALVKSSCGNGEIRGTSIVGMDVDAPSAARATRS